MTQLINHYDDDDDDGGGNDDDDDDYDDDYELLIRTLIGHPFIHSFVSMVRCKTLS